MADFQIETDRRRVQGNPYSATRTARWGESLRIVGALAAKDIVDAVKNRTTLSVVLMTLLLVIVYRFLPALEAGKLPVVLVFDPAASALVTAFESSPDVSVLEFSSRERLEFALRKADVPELGLVFPPDLEQMLAAGVEPVIDGYVPHWVTESEARRLQSQAEQALAGQLGRPVHVTLEGNTIFAQKDSTGYGFVAASTIVIVVLLVGVSLVPNLMLEEKRARTLDVLLVSPATAVDIALGKAVAGLFYGLVAVAVALGLNAGLVTHWPVALLTAVVGTAFGVSLGLVLGSVIGTRQQLQLCAWVALVPLLLPLFLSIMGDLVPAGMIAVLRWMPMVALSRALRVSFSARVRLADFLPELAVVAACAVLALAVVAWVMRRQDR